MCRTYKPYKTCNVDQIFCFDNVCLKIPKTTKIINMQKQCAYLKTRLVPLLLIQGMVSIIPPINPMLQ